MKRTILLKIYIGCCIILLSSCGNNNQDNSSNSPTKQAEESTNQEIAGLKAGFLGNYHGIQPSYFMKNHLAKLTQAIYQVGQSDQNNEKHKLGGCMASLILFSLAM